MVQASLMEFGSNGLAFIVAIIVIVFVHEFGHFIIGRLCGVKVEAFSIGFGREIFGYTDKYGTRWKFSWIPLGGYVRFAGDANAASMPSSTSNATPGSLQAANVWHRMAIVVAGPLANFVLAILIFALAFMFVGTPINEPRIDGVFPDSAAQAAGLQTGDYVRALDGNPIHSFLEIREFMILRGDTPVHLSIERNKQMMQIDLVPKFVEEKDDTGMTVRTSQIGISHNYDLDPKGVNRLSLFEALAKGTKNTYFIVSTTMRYLGKMIVGAERADQLHGPVGVAQMAGHAASQGTWVFITFIALISVSIGLVNLFPIPMLDGGHLVFYLIEAVFGKPVGPVAQEWSFRIGLSAMIMLMLFATRNDLSPWATRVFGW